MSRIHWDHVEILYRAQCNSGIILSIDDDAMIKALKNAGNVVFDTEWWVETLPNVLEHWGLRSKRWTDPTTQMPRLHYRLTNERLSTDTNGNVSTGTSPLADRLNSTVSLADRFNGTGPLADRINSTGPLTNRINSGKLNTGNLNPDRLRNEDK